MKINIGQDLDFYKKSQILNTIIHLINNTSNIDEVVNSQGQFAFRTDTNRLICFDGVNLKEIAWKDDVVDSTKINMFYQEENPIGDANIGDVAIWYRPSDESLKILNKSIGSWVTLSTNATNNATIEEWQANTDYPNHTIVIHDNKFYQNQTGTDNNDTSWNAGNWTEISQNPIGSLSQNTFLISTSIGDGATLNNVTRTGNNYNIQHSLNVQYPLVKIYDLTNKEVYIDDITYVDANNTIFSFNKAITENFNVIISA